MKTISNQEKIRAICEKDGAEILEGKQDIGSAAIIEDNVEEYARFRSIVELKHLYSKISFKNKVVLDAGCGPGRLSFAFAQKAKKVVGIDFATNFIEIANIIKSKSNVENVEFVCGSVLDYVKNFDNEKFDIVFQGGVICYLNDQETSELLKGMKSLLKNEYSVIVLREPVQYNATTTYSEIDTKRCNDDFLKLFSIAGLDLVYQAETFLICPIHKYYQAVSVKKRKMKIIKYFFRILFTLNVFIDTFFRLFSKSYIKRFSSGWTIKQKYYILKKKN